MLKKTTVSCMHAQKAENAHSLISTILSSKVQLCEGDRIDDLSKYLNQGTSFDA